MCGKVIEVENKRQIYCSDKCRAKKYYQKNKQKYIDISKRWQKENPEEARKINIKANLKYRTNNREKFNKKMLEQYKKNKEKWRIRRVASNHRKEILDIQNNKCNKCGIEDVTLWINIKDWNWKKKNNKNNFDLNKDKVECLCLKCHPGRINITNKKEDATFDIFKCEKCGREYYVYDKQNQKCLFCEEE